MQHLPERHAVMRKPLIILAIGLPLASCAPSSILSKTKSVSIDGQEHTVRSTAEGYEATVKSGLFAPDLTESEIYVGNLRAIRDATGCPVATGSVVNDAGKTRATLACPQGMTPRI